MEQEILYVSTDNLLSDVRTIIDSARTKAYAAVNVALVERNWLLGKRIAEEELQGENRAEYGANVIIRLSKDLTDEYGKGFNKSNLYQFCEFYKSFPEIFHTACGKSAILLSWSHYRTLLQVYDKKARDWYMQEAISQTWSVRTLQRNISSQYYYRLLQSQRKDLVEKEMLESIIMQSLDELYSKDKFLIDNKVAERDIVHRFAHYFENYMVNTNISLYNVDCEYNRSGYEIKQIDGSHIYPDFILHKRGLNKDNLLVIEFKTWWNPDNNSDIDKIRQMMHPDLIYQYKFGCSVTINKDNAEIFWVDF